MVTLGLEVVEVGLMGKVVVAGRERTSHSFSGRFNKSRLSGYSRCCVVGLVEVVVEGHVVELVAAEIVVVFMGVVLVVV